MLVRITESELIEPALIVMYNSTKGFILTSRLRKALRKQLNPQGEDLKILKNRNDDKFSQKVRNLKSHKAIKKLGYAKHVPFGFYITEKGRKYLEKYDLV